MDYSYINTVNARVCFDKAYKQNEETNDKTRSFLLKECMESAEKGQDSLVIENYKNKAITSLVLQKLSDDGFNFQTYQSGGKSILKILFTTFKIEKI